MAKWRELKYYEKGTPCKTAKRYRVRHLFTDYSGHVYSPCGIICIDSRLSEGPTDVRLCGHCVKAVNRRRKKR
ncbi:hypothetical protein KAR91_02535 [Candidatus Pacearchaeota archaeon]|nr:hypothetical protein [Candidatus Pacearchaeota archaeon]